MEREFRGKDEFKWLGFIFIYLFLQNNSSKKHKQGLIEAKVMLMVNRSRSCAHIHRYRKLTRAVLPTLANRGGEVSTIIYMIIVRPRRMLCNIFQNPAKHHLCRFLRDADSFSFSCLAIPFLMNF